MERVICIIVIVCGVKYFMNSFNFGFYKVFFFNVIIGEIILVVFNKLGVYLCLFVCCEY